MARHQIAEDRVRPLTPVIAMLKILHVLRQVLRRNVNVRPADLQFQPSPKPLDPVDVATLSRIFAGPVVNGPMVVANTVQSAIVSQFVGVSRGARLNILGNEGLQGALLHVLDHLRYRVAAALQRSEDDRLIRNATPALPASRLAADLGFVGLNFAAQRPFAVHSGHVLAHFMRSAPSRLVGHADLALQFLRRYPMARSR